MPASANIRCSSRRRRKRSSSIWSSAWRPSIRAKLMMRTSLQPSRCIRGMARFASSREESNGCVICLPQFAIADPKQLMRTPASWSLPQTASNSLSGMSWMFLPPMFRDSMLLQPSSFVARICPSISSAASSANPVRYIFCSLLPDSKKPVRAEASSPPDEHCLPLLVHQPIVRHVPFSVKTFFVFSIEGCDKGSWFEPSAGRLCWGKPF